MRIGEYWITDTGGLIPADGDYGDSHEDVVIGIVITKILDAIGHGDLEFSDRVSFRCWLNDEYFPDAYGWDEEDPYGRLAKELSKSIKNPVEELKAITGHPEDDARLVAINLWGWIRLAGFNAELPSLSERNLKRLGEGILDALFEEGEEGDEDEMMKISVRVSTYSGKNSQNRSMTIGELIDNSGGTSGANFAQSASGALRKADVAMQPAFYGARLGDSIFTISNLLECRY
jgi:hypothetical protein